MREVRCAGSRPNGKSCGYLVMALSADFDGDVSTKCRRCKSDVAVGSDVPAVRLNCLCRKWLATGSVRAGYVQAVCRSEHVLVRLNAKGVQQLEMPARSLRPIAPLPPDFVQLIEERWQMLRLDRVHRSTELAVGLRFDVFARDGFRCRYCGRGPDQGVYLEVDHVVPRSAGGPDTMANLVTACWDCNRGKSAKEIIQISA